MKKINSLHCGCILLKLFLVLLVAAVAFWIPGIMGKFSYKAGITVETAYWLIKLIEIILLESTIFWIGIILVYINSVQLGLKWKFLGIILGWVPIANIIMLGKIISLCSSEVKTESSKIKLNKSRADQKICATKYPILMVHGVFFRDFEHLNYWGRIPGELIANGAQIFYGNHNSASPVTDSAIELENRIQEIIAETGCEKVNVIAHSKGGLDICTCVSKSDVAKNVASITTINTPHRGCEFADYLLTKIPENQQNFIANTYNKAAAKLGDINPDFLAAVNDLTSTNCAKLQEQIVVLPEIYYQSFGSKLNHATSGRFPLNMTYNFVKYFDGPNDGLVGEESFKFGDNYTFLTNQGVRGISHADMIDLNRENIPGFDVREFYVQLVADLKNKGF